MAELLGAEGVIGIRHVRADQEEPAELGAVPAVVVYGSHLSPSWIDALDGFARRGGTVVAIEPGLEFLARCHIEDLGPLPTPVVGVDLARVTDGAGLRIHVGARSWRSSRGEAVGTFSTPAREASPAIIRVTHGAGTVHCWAFDMARNIALIRQGNPEWTRDVNSETAEVRLHDAMRAWLRPERFDRPDADVFQNTLMGQLAGASANLGGPIVCLDYFPGHTRSVFVATSDSHWGGADVLDRLVRRVEDTGGRLSVYYQPPPAPTWRRYARRARWTASELPLVGVAAQSDLAPPSPRQVNAWRARGHEFAPHPDVADGLDAGLATAWQRFGDDGYGTSHPTTRTHAVLWTGWAETARAQRGLGVRMNLDAYTVGSVMQRADGSWGHGHVIGSGLPVRFVDGGGEVIDCYQQPTQIIDEQLLAVFGGPEGLTGSAAADVAAELLKRALEGPSAALCGVFHADSFFPALGRLIDAGALLDGVLGACRRANVPVWTAARWLTFLDGRRTVSVTSRAWDAPSRRLACALDLPPSLEPGAAILLPAVCAGEPIREARLNGAAVALDSTSRGGREWARIVVQPGAIQLDARYGPA